jgi:hypothetical protein
LPLVDETCRHNNERSLDTTRSDQYAHRGNRLHRLTETHIIGEQHLALLNEDSHAVLLEWVERSRPIEQGSSPGQKPFAGHSEESAQAF